MIRANANEQLKLHSLGEVEFLKTQKSIVKSMQKSKTSPYLEYTSSHHFPKVKTSSEIEEKEKR